MIFTRSIQSKLWLLIAAITGGNILVLAVLLLSTGDLRQLPPDQIEAGRGFLLLRVGCTAP